MMLAANLKQDMFFCTGSSGFHAAWLRYTTRAWLGDNIRSTRPSIEHLRASRYRKAPMGMLPLHV